MSTMFWWLPWVIESAQFIFEVLDGADAFIPRILESVKTVDWDHQAEIEDGKRICFSNTILLDLLFLVKAPIFQTHIKQDI